MPLPFDPASRWVRATAVLAAAFVLVGGFLQVRAQRDASEAVAVAEARYAFQQDLTLAYDALAEPARDASVALSGLREVLQQHLALTGRTGEELGAERDERLAELTAAAAQLREAAASTAPPAPEALDQDAPASLGNQLRQLRSRADELADELDAAVERARAWTSALAELRRSALTFVEVAEQHLPTSDPAELAEQWRAERAPLERYRDGVQAAAALEGLAPVAAVHGAYVEANLAWVDEAVRLLEAGQLASYNARLDELFSGDDPFGFRADLNAAIEDAFGLGLLADLVAARDDVTGLLDRIAEARRLTPILLRPRGSDARPASPSPTPAPPADATD